MCRLTKMAHFVPTAEAEGVALLLLSEVIRLHGVPAAIVNDRDTRFTGDVWQNMCKRLSLQLKM